MSSGLERQDQEYATSNDEVLHEKNDSMYIHTKEESQWENKVQEIVHQVTHDSSVYDSSNKILTDQGLFDELSLSFYSKRKLNSDLPQKPQYSKKEYAFQIGGTKSENLSNNNFKQQKKVEVGQQDLVELSSLLKSIQEENQEFEVQKLTSPEIMVSNPSQKSLRKDSQGNNDDNRYQHKSPQNQSPQFTIRRIQIPNQKLEIKAKPRPKIAISQIKTLQNQDQQVNKLQQSDLNGSQSKVQPECLQNYPKENSSEDKSLNNSAGEQTDLSSSVIIHIDKDNEYQNLGIERCLPQSPSGSRLIIKAPVKEQDKKKLTLQANPLQTTNRIKGQASPKAQQLQKTKIILSSDLHTSQNSQLQSTQNQQQVIVGEIRPNTIQQTIRIQYPPSQPQQQSPTQITSPRARHFITKNPRQQC